MGVPPNHPYIKKIFPYKPTILGYLHVWNPPCIINKKIRKTQSARNLWSAAAWHPSSPGKVLACDHDRSTDLSKPMVTPNGELIGFHRIW